MILKKPCRRGPKPRKRIARNTKPIPRKSRPRAFRKGPKAAAKRLTKAEWSRTVRASYGGRCVYHALACDASDAAHVVPVGVRKAMELDPENGLPLCRRAHQWFTPRPKEWEEFARLFLGTDRYERLLARKRETA